MVLKSLGVAGDTDAGVQLVESLDDLLTQIVDDLYLAHFGSARDEAVLSHAEAAELARAVVGDPAPSCGRGTPTRTRVAAVRLKFATDVLAELEIRKHRLGILGYDDLLRRLADAFDARDSAARSRMRSALADRHGRRVPGHRPRAVGGDRPRVQRPLRPSS